VTTEPYKTEDELRELYHSEGLTIQEIADRFDTTFDSVRYYKRKYDIDGRPKGVSVKAWNLTEQDLRTLYEKERLTIEEIADQHDCSRTYIRNRMKEWDIERNRKGRRKRHASIQTSEEGYEIIMASDGRGRSPDTARVHQLVAIANGASPKDVFSGGSYHCHHKNRIPWDNRPGNVELLTESEHHEEHASEIDRNETGDFK
jgi:predicted DNA-binding protein YlxM (UPF0122 family)